MSKPPDAKNKNAGDVVEETNSSHGDIPYAMPDAEKAFQQAAYVNVASWAHQPQSPDVLAAAHNLAGLHPVERTITANDLAHIVASVRQKCMAGNVPLSEIDKIVGRINSNIGADISQLDDVRKEAAAAAGEAVSTAHDDGVQYSMNAAQAFEEQMKGLDRLNDQMRDLSGKLDHLKTDVERKEEDRLVKERDDAEKALKAVMDDPNATEEQKRRAMAQFHKTETNYNTFEKNFAESVPSRPGATEADKTNAGRLVVTEAEAQKSNDAIYSHYKQLSHETENPLDKNAYKTLLQSEAHSSIQPNSSIASNITLASENASNANLPIIKSSNSQLSPI